MSGKPRLISGDIASHVDRGDIIVFLLWHLGDVLNSTALFSALAAKHNRNLAFATTEPCVPIVLNNPYLDKIFILDLKIPKQVSFAEWTSLQRLPEKYFPLHATVCNLHVPVNLRKVERHILEIWAKSIGIDVPLSQLKPMFVAGNIHSQRIGYDSVFVVGNGGSNSRWRKCWPADRWNEFIETTKTRFPALRFIQLGAASDPSIDGVEDLRGKTTVDESYHLLKRARGCLTTDSFLAHFAAVAECPVFVIFGPTSPVHVRPLGNGDIFTVGGHRYCMPCSRNFCRLTLGLTPCFAFPSVKEVVAEVEMCLARDRVAPARR